MQQLANELHKQTAGYPEPPKSSDDCRLLEQFSISLEVVLCAKI